MISTTSISTRFVNAVGFSNGCAELVLKKPPPLVPEQLDRLLRGDRSHRDRLRQVRERRERRVVREVLDRALEHEHQRDHERDRRQHPQHGAHEVVPEVAEAGSATRHDPADQRDRDRDPDARRQEVLHGEPRHLAEVAHRRLAAVVLPVRVGHERRRRVERHVPRRRVELLWVEAGEVPQRLRAQDQVQQQPPREREDDHALGIGLPVLTLVGVDPHDAVEQPLRCRNSESRSVRSPV